jgi:hypothetical protein
MTRTTPLRSLHGQLIRLIALRLLSLPCSSRTMTPTTLWRKRWDSSKAHNQSNRMTLISLHHQQFLKIILISLRVTHKTTSVLLHGKLRHLCRSREMLLQDNRRSIRENRETLPRDNRKGPHRSRGTLLRGSLKCLHRCHRKTTWMLLSVTREALRKITSTLLHDNLRPLHSRSSQLKHNEASNQTHV